MNFNRHSNLEGQHAFLGASKYHWINYDEDNQRSGDFLSRVDELRKQRFTYTDKDGKVWTGDNAIAKAMGLTSTQFRTQLGLARDERRSSNVATAKRLRDEGKTLKEIADTMGFPNDSSVRSLLNESSEARMNQAKKTAEFLRQQIAEKGMIDVGTGVERELGISREKLNQALYMLEMEGYAVYGGGVPQVTNKGQQTNLKVLCPPGTEHKDIYNFGEIHSVVDYISPDGGETFKPAFVYPESMDSSRLKIRYAEEGGLQRDGTVELRRGVADLSLGESSYAQVRILVDGKKYIKGMAFYGDDKDFPDGVDVIFNTNKKKGTPTAVWPPPPSGAIRPSMTPPRPSPSVGKSPPLLWMFPASSPPPASSSTPPRSTGRSWPRWKRSCTAKTLLPRAAPTAPSLACLCPPRSSSCSRTSPLPADSQHYSTSQSGALLTEGSASSKN